MRKKTYVAVDQIIGADSDQAPDDEHHPQPLEPLQLPLQEYGGQDPCTSIL